MKIQLVQKRSCQINKNNYTSLSINKINNDKSALSFGIATGRTLGGSGYLNYPPAWSAGKLRILKRTPKEMQHLAEYFHNKSDEELRAIAEKAHWISAKNAEIATARLIEFVTPLRTKKTNMDAKISNLEAKGYLSDSEKEELTRLKSETNRLDNKANSARDKFEKMICW